LRCVGARHIDPDKTELLQRLREQYPPTVAAHPVQRAIRTGEPQFVRDVQAEAIRWRTTKTMRAIRELGNTSGIVVPLIARGRTFGAITFGRCHRAAVHGVRLQSRDRAGPPRLRSARQRAPLWEVEARAHASRRRVRRRRRILVDSDRNRSPLEPAAAKHFGVKAGQAVDGRVSDVIQTGDR